MNRVGTQARSEKRQRNDPTFAQTGFFSINLHQLVIVEDFRLANIESFTEGLRAFKATDQVVQYIPYADRLTGGVNPAWSQDHRQTVNQVTQDFKGGTSRTDNHCRPQNGDRDLSQLQYLTDLTS